MTDITNTFGTLYHPQKAFVIYEQQGTAKHVYIESYDLDPSGRPINAHPLSMLEAGKLCKALQTTEKKQSAFLASKGLLPKNLLHMRSDKSPYALWHTPARYVKLYFRENLGIKSGYFGETDHPIPWQIDHLNCWRTDAANAVEAFTKIVI